MFKSALIILGILLFTTIGFGSSGNSCHEILGFDGKRYATRFKNIHNDWKDLGKNYPIDVAIESFAILKSGQKNKSDFILDIHLLLGDSHGTVNRKMYQMVSDGLVELVDAPVPLHKHGRGRSEKDIMLGPISDQVTEFLQKRNLTLKEALRYFRFKRNVWQSIVKRGINLDVVLILFDRLPLTGTGINISTLEFRVYDETKVSFGTTNLTISFLHKMGLVNKNFLPNNKKSTFYTISEKGLEFLKSFNEAISQDHHEI